MTNKVLVLSGMLLGWHSCTVASVVINEMVKAQHERPVVITSLDLLTCGKITDSMGSTK